MSVELVSGMSDVLKSWLWESNKKLSHNIKNITECSSYGYHCNDLKIWEPSVLPCTMTS